MEEQAKFIQLTSGRYLTALDERGIVWTYTGEARGWARLNMTRFVEPRSKLKRFPDPDYPDWHKVDDDIPF